MFSISPPELYDRACRTIAMSTSSRRTTPSGPLIVFNCQTLIAAAGTMMGYQPYTRCQDACLPRCSGATKKMMTCCVETYSPHRWTSREWSSISVDYPYPALTFSGSSFTTTIVGSSGPWRLVSSWRNKFGSRERFFPNIVAQLGSIALWRIYASDDLCVFLLPFCLYPAQLADRTSGRQ